MIRATSTTPAASALSRTSRAENRTISSAAGLQILVNLDHRGAVGADPLVGDGAGCMIQMPDAPAARLGRRSAASNLPPPGRYAVAMCFLPMDEAARAVAIAHFEHFVARRGAEPCWLGATSASIRPGSAKPSSRRCRISRRRSSRPAPKSATRTQFERKILTIRKQVLNSVSRARRASTACRRCGTSTCRPSRPARSSTRACCWRRRSRASTTICATR